MAVDARTRPLAGIRKSAWLTWALIFVVAVAGVVMQLTAFDGRHGLDAPLAIPWWALGLGFAIAHVFVMHIPVRRDSHTISLVEVPLILGLAFASPAGLLIGRLVGAAAALAIHRRLPPTKLAFNLALFYLETVCALTIYRLVLGTASPNTPIGWTAVLTAMVAMQLVGLGAVTAVIAINDRQRPLRVIGRTAVTSFALGMGSAVVGLMSMALVWQDVRGIAIVLLLAVALPLGVRTFGRLRSRSAELAALTSFTRSVDSSLDRPGIIRRALTESSETLRVEVAELVLHIDQNGIEPQRYSLLPNGSLTWAPVRETELADLLDAEDDVGPYFAARGVDKGLVAPIRVEGDRVGMMAVGNRLGPRAHFDTHDQELLEAIASHTSGSLT